MKKKIFLSLVFAFLIVGLFGCDVLTVGLIEENLSEATNVYYLGENDVFYCTLSSGEREDPYLMNGVSESKKDFSLLNITPIENTSNKVIHATIKIDGQQNDVELEINGLNTIYMVDLERKLSGNEIVEVVYKDSAMTLSNLSQAFEINATEAIEIARDQLRDKIVLKKNYRGLNAECYLRILDKKANNFDGIFWCFTVLNIDNESYSIIISTENGDVLAKSE